ncbi:hypothetical protein RhiirA4_488169 [Rhizophagus irregularis]|uniref:Uncharacterized protein n=1 Tax=Rhizophagus irregularis TaxID=588596 RepID=A0A2I1HTD7_9GLOM|nr:hypothetical protein RhiirA4_488169 [Rhizophagus irregularis]
MHLRYKKKYQIPLQSYYNFKIPSLQPSKQAFIRREVHIANYFNSTKHNLPFDPSIRSSVASTSQGSVVTSNPNIAISPTLKVDAPVFTPTKKVQPKGHKVPPNIFPIPEELLPYAPDVPIYKDGVTFENLTKAEQRKLNPLIVGSKFWIKAVKAIKSRADEKNALDAHIENIKIKWEVHDKELATFYDDWFGVLRCLQNACHDYFAYLCIVPDSSALFMPSSKKEQKRNNFIFRQRRLSELEADFEDINLELNLLVRHHELYYQDFCSKLTSRERKRKVDDYTNLDSFYGLHLTKRPRFVNKD